MQIIEKIIVSATTPERVDVIWIDNSAAQPIPKFYSNGEWEALDTDEQDLSGKEDKSNKVTSISAQSTDTQYPSAKAVYTVLGNIEILLSQI